MKKLIAAGLGLALAACTSTSFAAECTPAVWDMESINYNADGTSDAHPATSTLYCLADGAVKMDEFRSMDENGRTNFWGVSFSHSEPIDGVVWGLWLMVGDPGYTLVPSNHNEDGTRTSGGGGFDATGEFLERAITTFEDDGSYYFVMGRSFDNGETWIEPVNVINAAMTDRVPPEQPTQLVPVMQEGADALPEDFPRGTPILDGTAEVRTFERDGQVIVQFGSRYWEPNRWRVAEWVVGTDQVTFTEVEF